MQGLGVIAGVFVKDIQRAVQTGGTRGKRGRVGPGHAEGEEVDVIGRGTRAVGGGVGEAVVTGIVAQTGGTLQRFEGLEASKGSCDGGVAQGGVGAAGGVEEDMVGEVGEEEGAAIGGGDVAGGVEGLGEEGEGGLEEGVGRFEEER